MLTSLSGLITFFGVFDSNDSTLFYFSFLGRLCGRSSDGRHYIHVCGGTLSLL